jgi:hypothetical protein
MLTGSVTRLAANPEDYGFTNVTDSAQDQSVVIQTNISLGRPSSDHRRHYQIAAAASRSPRRTALPPALALNLSARLNVGTGDNVSSAASLSTAPTRNK